MNNGNASPVVFGFEYQVDAAICIFLRDINRILSVRVEGRFQDIEVLHSDGSNEFIQVKSIHDPQKKYTNDYNLKKALRSLARKTLTNIDSMSYCSNQKDNFIKNCKLFVDDRVIKYKYRDLDDDSRKRISDIIFEDSLAINTDSLSLLKIPYFQSDDIGTKKKAIIECAEKMLSDCSCSTYMAYDLVITWHSVLENVASSSKMHFVCTKEDFIYIIFAKFLTEKSTNISTIDESNREIVQKTYLETIRKKSMNYRTTNLIVNLYDEYSNTTTMPRYAEFIKLNQSTLLKEIFGINDSSNEIIIETLKAIVNNTLDVRLYVKSIKEKINL
jgi:hypothetical protein